MSDPQNTEQRLRTLFETLRVQREMLEVYKDELIKINKRVAKLEALLEPRPGLTLPDAPDCLS